MAGKVLLAVLSARLFVGTIVTDGEESVSVYVIYGVKKGEIGGFVQRRWLLHSGV